MYVQQYVHAFYEKTRRIFSRAMIKICNSVCPGRECSLPQCSCSHIDVAYAPITFSGKEAFARNACCCLGPNPSKRSKYI